MAVWFFLSCVLERQEGESVHGALDFCSLGHTCLFYFPFFFFIFQKCKMGDLDGINLAGLLQKGPTFHTVVCFKDGVRDCF